MINHERAQSLISARLDGSLATSDATALQAHLAGCDRCRRFVAQAETLAQGLRALPHLPPSPNVSRQVLEEVANKRSPWLQLGGFRLASAPAMAVIGSLVLVAALAFTIVLALNPPGGAGDPPAPTRAVLGALQPATEPPAPIASEPPTEVSEPPPAATEPAARPSPTPVPPTPTRVNVTVTVTPTVPDDDSAPLPASGAEDAAITGISPTVAPVVATATATSPRIIAAEPPASEVEATAALPAETEATAVVPLPAPTTPVEAEPPTSAPITATLPAPDPVPAGPTPSPIATAAAEPPLVTVVAAQEVSEAPIPEPPAAVPTATRAPLVAALQQPTATLVPTAVPTETPLPTATATATPLPTATSTPVPTATATSAPTATVTPLPTATATAVPTATLEPTATPAPTATATPEPTATPTAPATATAEPAATLTPAPTATATATPEPTATATATATLEPTATATPLPTATATPEPTSTATPEPTATATATPEPTATATQLPTATPEPTTTATPEPTATATLEPTATATPEPTATATATATPEPTATATPEPVVVATEKPTVEPTSSSPPIVPVSGAQPIADDAVPSEETDEGDLADATEGSVPPVAVDDQSTAAAAQPGTVEDDVVVEPDSDATETPDQPGSIASEPTAAPVIVDTPAAIEEPAGPSEESAATETTFQEAPVVGVPDDDETPTEETAVDAEPIATIATGETGGDATEDATSGDSDSAAAPDEESVASDSDDAAEVILDEPAATSEVVPANEDGDTPIDEATEETAPSIVPVDGSQPVGDSPLDAVETEAADPPQAIEDADSAEIETPAAVVPDEPQAADQNQDAASQDAAAAAIEAIETATADVIVDEQDVTDDQAAEPDTADNESGSSAIDPVATIESGDAADEDQTETRGGRERGAPDVVLTLPVAVAGSDVTFTEAGVTAFESGGGVTIVDPAGGGETLPDASDPIWSPLGGVLLVSATFDGNTSPTAAIWDSASGSFQPLAGSTPDEDAPYRDLPAGWVGSVAYYQRVYFDGSGQVELRFAEVTGGVETGTAWSGEGGNLFGDGVTAAKVSPDGASIAYAQGGQLFLAPLANPVDGAVPVGGAGVGFDWSPRGNRIAVSDGSTVTLYNRAGASIQSESIGGADIGAPLWRQDGINVPLLDGSGAVVRIALDASDE